MGSRFRHWGVLAILPLAALIHPASREWVRSQWNRFQKRDLNQIEREARQKLISLFQSAQLSYPPAEVTLVFLKDEKTLALYGSSDRKWKKVKTYPVFAASGGPGPKLKEGDRQVPEGIYRVELLNPRSRFHLSLRLNYPNEWDRKHAEAEGRSNLGGDIMIHGNAVSIGCIAIGDSAIEEVFTLAKDSDFKKWKVLLAPTDLSLHDFPAKSDAVKGLYENIAAELGRLKN